MGVRLSDTAYELLRPHVSGTAVHGELEASLWDRFVARWSYNAYGTERQHVAFGSRFRRGDRAPVGGIPD